MFFDLSDQTPAVGGIGFQPMIQLVHRLEADATFFPRGLTTSSPLQLGQTFFI
jgi:hypothetical protein